MTTGRGSTREPPTWTGYQGGDGACSTCADVGRRGYCAPNRCYCGHETCHAVASWQPLTVPNVVSIPDRKKDTKRWDERSGGSWIDKL